MKLNDARTQAYKEALSHLHEAMAAEKCRACGCFHHLLLALEKAFPEGEDLLELGALVKEANRRLTEQQYDCLGCEVCIPPLVLNTLSQALGEVMADLQVCPTEKVVERRGWPPLPGAYQVLRYQAPVAICTLTSEDLMAEVIRESGPEIAMVGTMHTENLGIERLIQNVLANPHLRFVIVCGPDSQKAVGHYPGQSLAALTLHGINDHKRIIAAQGRRPLLKNLSPEAVAHFREVVEVVDLIGECLSKKVIAAAERCASRNPGPARPCAVCHIVTPLHGYLPSRSVSDPAGYFVIYVDQGRRMLSLEHYLYNGLLDTVIEGASAAELYTPAIDRGLISRLDHAAYLGRELARAEQALKSGEPFVQDAAPELALPVTLASLTCGPACNESGA
jgi:tetrahydromethanopterin S-methyltransferase subunit A